MVAAAPLSPQLRELLARVAAHPHGLGFLHLGNLECISVTLEVHPRHVLEARELLESESGRAQIIDEVRRARRRGPGTWKAGSHPRDPDPCRGVSPTDPRALIEAARRHPLGLSFLRRAPFETVAVTFQVCPNVVFQARDLLAKADSARRDSEGHER